MNLSVSFYFSLLSRYILHLAWLFRAFGKYHGSAATKLALADAVLLGSKAMTECKPPVLLKKNGRRMRLNSE